MLVQIVTLRSKVDSADLENFKITKPSNRSFRDNNSKKNFQLKITLDVFKSHIVSNKNRIKSVFNEKIAQKFSLFSAARVSRDRSWIQNDQDSKRHFELVQ